MGFIDCGLPFPIQPPSRGRLILPNNVPDFDGAYSIASNERKRREKIHSQDFEPKPTNWILRIWFTDRLLCLGVNWNLSYKR